MRILLVCVCGLSAMTIAGCPETANDDATPGGASGTGVSSADQTGDSGRSDNAGTVQLDPGERLFVAAVASIGDKTRTVANDTTNLIVSAVFEASAQAGGVFTTTGTLTQIAAGVQQFAYSPTPTDRLVLAYTNADRIEFTVAAFIGSFDSVQAFTTFHSDLDFTAKSAGVFDFRVQSNSGDPDGIGGIASEFDNRISGSLTLEDGDVRVNLTYLGTTSADSDSGQLLTTERITGTASAAGGSISVDDSFEFGILGSVVQFRSRRNSSGNLGGAVYRLEDVVVQGEITANVVAQPEFWQATGKVLQAEQALGTFQFDGPAIRGAAVPRVILKLATGDNIEL